MKKIFWVLVVGAVASAAMAVGLSRAAESPRPASSPKAAR
jgi:hypothetical protein